MASLRCLGARDFGTLQVGDGARGFEDAVVGARGKPQALDGRFDQLFAFAELAQCSRISLGGEAKAEYAKLQSLLDLEVSQVAPNRIDVENSASH